MPRALVVDDDLDQRETMSELLTDEGFVVTTASSLKQARAALDKAVPEAVLLDLHLPDGKGLELLDDLAEKPDVEIVMMTGQGSLDTAVEALRKGATDYLRKPVDFSRLQATLNNVKRNTGFKREIHELRDELRKLGRFGGMVGSSSPMQRVYDLVSKVAPTKATVFISGESGCGKELLAQSIHGLSRRKNEPFLALNCGAVATTLIESELFGHEKGSFTGADKQHRGFFERAHGGTLFLDEITEMSIELQVKLLRVLETNEVIRTGGDRSIPVDVRIVAATNRDAHEAIEAGKLREDLFYRLNVFPVPLPPLRDRLDDIPLLVKHILSVLNKENASKKTISARALSDLQKKSWPGNVRQLKNEIQRAYILADDEIGPDHFESGGETLTISSEKEIRIKIGTTIAESERQLILATLEELSQDKKRAAETLGISLKTLYNRLNVYEGHPTS